ncbi:MAG TPA: ATPase, T2SS/T4P/T4SS family [Negativicutes bacterium]|nr:ATPase, T2SS/T4P/T4SS family [Negativicutes bacterium]
MSLKKSLTMDKLLLHLEKCFFNYINSDPEDEQERKIVLLLRDYKEKSTSGLPEARNVIKAHIKNLLLTGFNIYLEDRNRNLTDICLSEEVKVSEENKLVDCMLPFDEPEKLTGMDKFEIILYLNRDATGDGRDGAFKKLLDRYGIYEKTRKTDYYESVGYEYNSEDIELIYSMEVRELDFADKLEIVTQRIYEELFGLKHIDILAYSDVNEVGFSNDGRYIYCWCGRKIWLSFMALDEREARVVQDRAISFEKHSPQLDVSHPEVLCHRGDGARITVTQRPYFSSRNLCIRIFNQSTSGFLDLITLEKLRVLIIALVKAGESICLQGSLGSGKTTTMNIMYELLDDYLHIGTVEDYFEQHIMDKYPYKRIVEGQSINGKELLDVVKTMLRMSVDVANIGEVRDGNALFSFIQLVQSVSVAAWFTTHITNPETTVPRLKNMLTGTGRYFSEQSAVMDIIHYINMIFQHEIVDGQIMISRVVEIVPLVTAFSEFDYRNEPDIEKLKRLYYLQQIQGNPNNMFSLKTIMEMRGGSMRFVNYPSVRMIEKSRKSNTAWKYVCRLIKMIEEDTGMDIPEYARECIECLS